MAEAVCEAETNSISKTVGEESRLVAVKMSERRKE